MDFFNIDSVLIRNLKKQIKTKNKLICILFLSTAAMTLIAFLSCIELERARECYIPQTIEMNEGN